MEDDKAKRYRFPLLQGDATEQQITERLDTVFIEALKRMNSTSGGAS